MTSARWFTVSAMVLALGAGQALATPIISLEAGFATELEARNQDNFQVDEVDDKWVWSGGPWVEEELGWTIESFEVTFSDNPFLASTFTVTNNTAQTQSFVLDLTLPSGVDFANTLASGWFEASLTDNTGDGASLDATAGEAMYSGWVAGQLVQELRPYPDGLSFAAGAQGVEVVLNQLSFADVAGPALSVGDPVTLRHRVDISAGDTATLSGELTIIPEPGAVVMLGVGAMLLLGRRRRREG